MTKRLGELVEDFEEAALERGRRIGQIQLAQEMLLQMPSSTVELKRLSVEQLDELLQTLRAQLAATRAYWR